MLWRSAPDESPLRRGLRAVAQLVALTWRGFVSDRLLLRASALTYVTALSIIPMLGVVIAIVGAVGGDETLVDFAIDQLTTVAPSVRETVRERGLIGLTSGLSVRVPRLFLSQAIQFTLVDQFKRLLQNC